MIGRIEERVDLCDGHSLLRLSHLDDFVAGAELAVLEHPQVEPRPSAGRQQCRHPGLVHSNADAIAGNARLRNFEQRADAAVATHWSLPDRGVYKATLPLDVARKADIHR